MGSSRSDLCGMVYACPIPQPMKSHHLCWGSLCLWEKSLIQHLPPCTNGTAGLMYQGRTALCDQLRTQEQGL